MTLKKRIIGFLLLIAGIMIIIPVFLGRSISSDELKLSAHVPTPPAKPKAISAPLPTRSTTIPAIAQVSPPTVATNVASSVAVERLESTSSSASSAVVVNSLANVSPAINTNPENLSSPKTKTPAVVTSPARSTVAENPSNSSASKVSPILPLANGSEAKISLPITAPPTSAAGLTSPAVPASAPIATPMPTPTTLAEAIPVVQSELIAAKDTSALAKNKNVSIKSHKSTKSAHTALKALPKASKLPPAAEAWSVQLGSFSSKTNAQKLMQDLQSKGFTAYLRTTKTANGDFTRVLVGPRLQQREAAQLQTRIQKEINMQGVLVKLERG